MCGWGFVVFEEQDAGVPADVSSRSSQSPVHHVLWRNISENVKQEVYRQIFKMLEVVQIVMLYIAKSQEVCIRCSFLGLYSKIKYLWSPLQCTLSTSHEPRLHNWHLQGRTHQTISSHSS